ncbi:hypothetical protein C1H46_017739 [Malus baccata]|uniref:Uncharacterized protein n=1 Tax=Malus baccata TaxID=106549 RepID=A0A540MD84_MALBA|nr:hypothetical protein C1H46_017739 [Malus baccata]
MLTSQKRMRHGRGRATKGLGCSYGYGSVSLNPLEEVLLLPLPKAKANYTGLVANDCYEMGFDCITNTYNIVRVSPQETDDQDPERPWHKKLEVWWLKFLPRREINSVSPYNLCYNHHKPAFAYRHA